MSDDLEMNLFVKHVSLNMRVTCQSPKASSFTGLNIFKQQIYECGSDLFKNIKLYWLNYFISQYSSANPKPRFNIEGGIGSTCRSLIVLHIRSILNSAKLCYHKICIKTQQIAIVLAAQWKCGNMSQTVLQVL